MIVTAASALLIAAIGWGAFSFGAVYPWGYWPLAIAAAILGLFGVLRRWRLTAFSPHWSLPTALTAFVLATSLQLVPLPPALLGRLSPDAHEIRVQYDPLARISSTSPLSISPPDTRRGLALAASLALLMVGLSRFFAFAGTTRVCSGIAATGVLLALTGIVQKALDNGKILGFWTSLEGGTPFGPFVNRNHFAGWMLMAVPVSLGLLCAMISRRGYMARPTLRDRLLWFASSSASQAVLLAAGVAVMVLSILMSMSRSGISAAAAAVALTGVLAWRRYPRRSQGLAVVGVLAATAIVAIVWAGPDQISERFSQVNAERLNGRLGPWADALRIAERYPITGTGFNTYSVVILFYQQFNVRVYYSAAHNDYLQLLAEGGALLAVPAFASIAALTLIIRQRFREETSGSTYWIRAGATIGLIAIGMQEVVDFSLQIPGNAFLFAVVCALAIHRTPQRHRA